MRGASRACFALALAVGLWLVARGGWPILLAGVAAAAAALAYAGGPRPISYTPFGDFVVWLFFGLVAVAGTYYLQAASLSPGVLIAATMVGLPASAVLVVNNYRDLETDAAVGKKTLAVCLGRAFSRWEYAALMLTPFALLAALAAQHGHRRQLADPAARFTDGDRPGAAFLERDARPRVLTFCSRSTARFQVLFALLLCVAILLG